MDGSSLCLFSMLWKERNKKGTLFDGFTYQKKKRVCPVYLGVPFGSTAFTFNELYLTIKKINKGLNGSSPLSIFHAMEGEKSDSVS